MIRNISQQVSQKKAGYKLSCPIPLYCSAWNNIYIWLGAHEIRAHLILHPGDSGTHNTTGLFAEVRNCWKLIADENKFPAHYEKFTFPQHIPQNSEAVLSALLLLAAIVENLNQPDRKQLTDTLMAVDLPYNNIITAALRGGVVMQSSNSGVPLSLYCPAGLSHAIIHAPVLAELLNTRGNEGSLTLWLYGLMYSNFEVLRESFKVFHGDNPLISDSESLWILPLFGGQYWWVAAQNNHILESSLDQMIHWPKHTGLENITTESIYRTEIDRQGAIKH